MQDIRQRQLQQLQFNGKQLQTVKLEYLELREPVVVQEETEVAEVVVLQVALEAVVLQEEQVVAEHRVKLVVVEHQVKLVFLVVLAVAGRRVKMVEPVVVEVLDKVVHQVVAELEVVQEVAVLQEALVRQEVQEQQELVLFGEMHG